MLRVLLLVVGISIGGLANSATCQQARSVFNKLARVSTGYTPIFICSPSKHVNAYAGNRTVIITKGMLNWVSNIDQLAVVLGHELGHLTHSSRTESMTDELTADKWGFIYAKQAGYNACRGISILARMHGGDGIHPEGKVRYNALKGRC